MLQRTEEWHLARLAKVTASRVYDVVKKGSSGYLKARENYMSELLCERLSGEPYQTITTPSMQRGIDKEPLARSFYENITGVMVLETGFVNHPLIKGFGASPDGLVSHDGLIEIKCPNTAQHITFIRTGKIDPRYEYQMLAQLDCTGRKWCDFVSFDDRLPENLVIKIKRFYRDDEKIKEMESEIVAFLNELDCLEKQIREAS